MKLFSNNTVACHKNNQKQNFTIYIRIHIAAIKLGHRQTFRGEQRKQDSVNATEAVNYRTRPNIRRLHLPHWSYFEKELT